MILSSLLVSLLFVESLARTAYVGAPAAAGPKAQQNTSTTLVAALKDPLINSVVIISNYSVEQTFHSYVGSPLPINRNLTIYGLHGVRDVLDMDYERSIINLCSTCVLKLHDVTLANERRGTGLALDFVLGQPGSKVYMYNINRLHRACVSGPAVVPVVLNTPRSTIIDVNASKQLFDLRNVTFYDHPYPESLHLIDFSADYPIIMQEGRGPSGGYSGQEVNVTRLCQHVVTEECLQEVSPDVCVNHLIDEVISEQNAAAAGSGLSRSKLAIAVAVPVVVAGLSLLVLVALYIKKQHKQHRDKQGSIESGVTGIYIDKDVQAVIPSPSVPKADGAPVVPLADVKGWQVISSITTPLIRAEHANEVHFGELLGTGSFGRVYKAVWAGREVAVKVIDHDISSAAAIDNEVQLMFLFNHPNIVRAYHYLTYSKAPSSTACSATAPDANSAADAKESGSVSSSMNPSWMGPLFTVLHQQQEAAAPPGTPAEMSRQQGHCSSDQLDQDEGNSRDTARCMLSDLSSAAVASAPGGAAAATNKGPEIRGLQDSKGSLDDKHAPHETPVGGLDIVGTSSKTGKAETWLVQEYCDCGTLGHITGDWKASGECEQCMLSRLLLLQDCAQGLKALHNQHVVHGDLNARNVLVSSSPTSPIGLCAKLADLGLSRVIKQHQTHRTTNTVGTMSHMPPELLRYGRMSAAVDIYAFGVMMWEVFTGQPAFKKLHYGQFFETVVLRNLRPMIPAGMPADYQLLMEHCWATDPADRPSIDRVLECLRFMVQERQQCSSGSVVQPATAVSAPAGPTTPHVS